MNLKGTIRSNKANTHKNANKMLSYKINTKNYILSIQKCPNLSGLSVQSINSSLIYQKICIYYQLFRRSNREQEGDQSKRKLEYISEMEANIDRLKHEVSYYKSGNKSAHVEI